MALQSVNKHGLTLWSGGPYAMSGTVSGTMDAAGESQAGIGQIFLENGSAGGTKTLSTGKIYWRAGTTTFVNSGTTVRIGLQDVSSTTGLEDGTFDVYQDLVGGTDTITTGIMVTTMDTGTKTVTHGDIVAVCIEMISRGGSDSVINTKQSASGSINFGLPYCTADTGSLAKSASVIPSFIIEFDDGTLGWFNPGVYLLWNLSSNGANIDFSSSSTPDEYAAVFKVPFRCSINSMAICLGSPTDGRAYETILYSDPLGTPSVVEAVTLDEMYATAGLIYTKTSEHTLEPGTYYAVAVRPTTTSTVRVVYMDLGAGNEKMKIPSDFGVDCLFCARTNQTGAFAEVQDHYMPFFGISVSKLDDGGPTTAQIAEATWEYGNRTLTA